MKVNALMMDPADNVVTCIREIMPGEEISYRVDGTTHTLTAQEKIPYCHKTAIHDIDTGGEVVKYGEVIGAALEPLKAGCWVSHLNIRGIPRNYEDELL